MSKCSGGKTPVTALQEYCVKKLVAPPRYIFTENESSAESTTKTFSCSVQAFGETADGCGLSQKIAKHDAAANIIKKLESSHPDIKEMCVVLHAPITVNVREKLTALCAAGNLPLPFFDIINQTKPPEIPKFTAECRVGAIRSTATSTTKSGAKQLAALDVLNIIEKRSLNQNNNIRVVSLDPSIELKTQQGQLRTYREIANLEAQSFKIGELANRHNFFQKIDSNLKEHAKKVLNDEAIHSDQHKVDLLLSALEIKYKVQTVPAKTGGCMEFVELFCDLDVVFLARKEEIYKEILNYFKDML